MMAKIFDNCPFVYRLPQDDPECKYVNKMMEMPADVLRAIYNKAPNFESIHGVVPTNRLPIGYSYGNIEKTPKEYVGYEKVENKNGFNFNSQSSSKSNSTNRMEVDKNYELNNTDEKMIETVRGDLVLSEDDEERGTDETPVKSAANLNQTPDNLQLIFDTIEACSKKIPNLNSQNIFPKYYRPNLSNLNGDLKNTKQETTDIIPNDMESSVDKAKQCDENLKKFINLLSESKYKANMASSFQSIYNLVNSNSKKRKVIEENLDEKTVSSPKIPKLSVLPEKERKVPIQDSCYEFLCNPNGYELSFTVIPKLTKDICDKLFSATTKISEVQKEVTLPAIETKPKYVTQDSLPFNKSDSIPKKEPKLVTEQSAVNNTITNTISNDNVQNTVRKPEAAAMQFFASHSNLANVSNDKIAIVAGKVNENQSSIQSKIERHQPTSQLPYKDTSEGIPAIQGLNALRRMKANFKNEFIARVRTLDTDLWLKEVQSLKEKAKNCKGQLDYAPQIMVYIRKNLFYNYSLEVKSDYSTSSRANLENADIIKRSCFTITKIYNDHEKLAEKNSSRLWNINLVKHFTVIMCHRLSAILQYRAYRNVIADCKRIRETLLRAGFIDAQERATPSVCGGGASPASGLSSVSVGGGGGGSLARICSPALGASDVVPLSGDTRADIARYMEHTNIINSAYSDWMLAETHHADFCNRSKRHEQAWQDFEAKLIERTGGIVVSTIDESLPFVVKYLEGYINYMSDFMKRNL